MGFCFTRTSELVRAYASEQVLQWTDVLFSEELIHVPAGVAKTGGERYISLASTAKRWLMLCRKQSGSQILGGLKRSGALANLTKET
jgi:hypothetical protein